MTDDLIQCLNAISVLIFQIWMTVKYSYVVLYEPTGMTGVVNLNLKEQETLS